MWLMEVVAVTEHLLALDPGSDKIGTAVLNYKGEEKEKTIIKRDELIAHLREIFEHYNIREIISGNGTGSKELIELIEENFKEYKITLVEEEFTTEEAQKRYLKEKPMSNYEKLLRKFISWKVKKPLDDYAALIIGENYLKNTSEDE